MAASEKSVDDVCEFLLFRQVSQQVVSSFRSQKIDGKVVNLVTDNQLTELGLTAIGDKITLQDYCKGEKGKQVEDRGGINPQVSQSHEKVERRKQLLQLLRRPSDTRKVQQTNGRLTSLGGWPKKLDRAISFGLRLCEDELNSMGDRIAVPVKSPLGDKNTISVMVPMTEDYYKVLSIVTDAFFPDGKNPVVGEETSYVQEIVNYRNHNVRDGVGVPFTFGKYIEEKKVPGTPKCYLLCTSITPPEDETLPTLDMGSSSFEEGNQTPSNLSSDMENTNMSVTEMQVPGTPSGEVMLRIDPQQPDKLIYDYQQCKTVHDCVKATVSKLQMCSDPIEVLGYYQKLFLQGRALETTSLTDTTEGDTSPIFVSRFNLWETGIEELTQMKDANFRLPLEVTFYGELAQDLGGPRREFLTLMMKEAINEDNKIFSESKDGYTIYQTSTNLRKKSYFGAGVLAGFSMLQQGPLFSFLCEEQIQKLLYDKDLTESEKQFREGLNCLGLVDLAIQVPSFIYLLRSSAQKEINHRQLIHLLQPQFSEAGSNSRQMEEMVYSHFVSYLREVSAIQAFVHGKSIQITLKGHEEFVVGAAPNTSNLESSRRNLTDDLQWIYGKSLSEINVTQYSDQSAIKSKSKRDVEAKSPDEGDSILDKILKGRRKKLRKKREWEVPNDWEAEWSDQDEKALQSGMKTISEVDIRMAELAEVKDVLVYSVSVFGSTFLFVIFAVMFLKYPEFFVCGCCFCILCIKICCPRVHQYLTNPEKYVHDRMNQYIPGMIVEEDGTVVHYKPTTEELELLSQIIEELMAP